MGIEGITWDLFTEAYLLEFHLSESIDTTCRAPERRDSFKPSTYNIDALEMVQDEKHDNNINETNHNKVEDTEDYVYISAFYSVFYLHIDLQNMI